MERLASNVLTEISFRTRNGSVLTLDELYEFFDSVTGKVGGANQGDTY